MAERELALHLWSSSDLKLRHLVFAIKYTSLYLWQLPFKNDFTIWNTESLLSLICLKHAMRTE